MAVEGIRYVGPEEYSKYRMGDFPRKKLTDVAGRLRRSAPEYYEALHDDIERNGVQAPVLLRNNKTVMDGHHRLSIAHELGQHVPVGDYDNQDHYDMAMDHPTAISWNRKRHELGARRASYSRVCEGCNGIGENRGGHECGACDGSGRDPECICGRKVLKQPGEDWWSHLDGSISHTRGEVPEDEHGAPMGVAECMRILGQRNSERPQRCAYGDHPATKSLLWAEGHGYIPTCDADEPKARHQIEVTNRDEVAAVHHIGARWRPTQRLFGPTYGLDVRLFEGERLRPDVGHYVLDTLGGFWAPRYGTNWRAWARVYLAGSEASEWTSETREGNNDFDVLVGIDYDRCREDVSALGQLSDLAITDRMNAEFRADLIPHTDPTFITIDGRETGPWSNTFYVNPDSYDIRDIKPYAAYDITRDSWAVRPPHLPDWSIADFPQGHGLLQECQGYASVIRAILRQPEPYRSQQADALWKHLHGDRSRAFGPQGEGWYDAGNVIEKYLDQAGLWEQLAQVHFDAVAEPNKLLAPAGWSNTPERHDLPVTAGRP